MEAFCFKCRGKHELLNPQPIFFANGSPATQGTCANCGNEKVYKMGRTPEHAGLTPPVVERKPRVSKPKATSSKTKGSKSKKTMDDGRQTADGAESSTGNRQSSHGSGPLVIVESPTKAKTIGKFLGRRFMVRPSVGHIRDLPKNRLGVDTDKDFEPSYVIPMDKKKTVKELKEVAKMADAIWLATDPDREGEAISWHLTHALANELEGKPVHRVEFHEITQDAIKHAFDHPRTIDMNQVNAQQARRILDRLVGYKLSPLVSDKLSRRGLSAGRVQSVSVRLVVEREREIQAFVPVEYWTIEAELAKQLALESGVSVETTRAQSNTNSFRARLFKVLGQDPDLKNAADSDGVVQALEGANYVVQSVERKDRSRRPAAPFTTSTLQQEASRKLGFNARRTMGTAQSLYEGIDVGEGNVGLITYMRTDSVNVAEVAQTEARNFITERYGSEFMPDAPPKYANRSKNAQEAHEAVRPTSVFRTPDSIKASLDKDQFRLYDLIWKRFVASQMANAIFDATTVDIDAKPVKPDEVLKALEDKRRAEAEAIAEAAAAANANKEISGQLDKVSVALPAASSYLLTASGQPQLPIFLFRATGSVIKFAGFLKVYEEGRDEGDKNAEGEGDSQDRRLPELFAAEPLDLLQLLPEQHFTQPPPRYTEASLVKALEEYGIGRPSTYAAIMTTIQGRDYVRKEGKSLVPTDLGFQVNDMLVANFGNYIDVGFTAHVEDELDDIETGTRQWQPILHEFYDPFKTAVQTAASNIPKQERVIEYTGEMCPECGTGQLLYRSGRFGKFIACSNFPKCRHVEPITIPGVHCPKCGNGKLAEKRMKGKGKRVFYGCTNYPNCDFTTWNKPLALKCPDGSDGLVVEVGKGKAKCLGSDIVFDIPEQISA